MEVNEFALWCSFNSLDVVSEAGETKTQDLQLCDTLAASFLVCISPPLLGWASNSC